MDERLNRVVLALGSNRGNRLKNLKKAVSNIELKIGKINARSGLYYTSSWGDQSLNPFINAAIMIETSKNPFELLKKCRQIELSMGRKRKKSRKKYANRIIDIDILYFEKRKIDLLSLKIPHPELQNRMFVLRPLVDIAAKMKHPILLKSNLKLHSICKDSGTVRKISQKI